MRTMSFSSMLVLDFIHHQHFTGQDRVPNWLTGCEFFVKVQIFELSLCCPNCALVRLLRRAQHLNRTAVPLIPSVHWLSNETGRPCCMNWCECSFRGKIKTSLKWLQTAISFWGHLLSQAAALIYTVHVMKASLCDAADFFSAAMIPSCDWLWQSKAVTRAAECQFWSWCNPSIEWIPHVPHLKDHPPQGHWNLQHVVGWEWNVASEE